MRKVDVEITDDESRPEGGYAVVLLRGLAALPDRAGFRIKPVDARDPFAGPSGEDWPRGEQTPVAIRHTDAGIELVVGPEIVECPALLPGTVGVSEIPAADVRGEFLWPSIRPTARPRRTHLSVVRPQRSAASATAPVDALRATGSGASVAMTTGGMSTAGTATGGSQRSQTLPSTLPAPTPDHRTVVRIEGATALAADQADRLTMLAADGSAPGITTGGPGGGGGPSPSSQLSTLSTSRSRSSSSLRTGDRAADEDAVAPPDDRMAGISNSTSQRETVADPAQTPAVATRQSSTDSGAAGGATTPAPAAGDTPRANAARNATSDTATDPNTSPLTNDRDLLDTEASDKPMSMWLPAALQSGMGRSIALAAACVCMVLGGYALHGLYAWGRSAQAKPTRVTVVATRDTPTEATRDRSPDIARPTRGQAADAEGRPLDVEVADTSPTAETRATALPSEGTADEAAPIGRSEGGRSTEAGKPAAGKPMDIVPSRQSPLATASASPTSAAPASSRATAPSAQGSVTARPAPSASEVTLRIRGGGFQVSGELRGFDGTKYVIATRSSGVMTMDASRFECQGEACSRPAAAILPPAERPNPLKPDRIAVEISSAFGSDFVPELVKSYAASIAATATEAEVAHDGSRPVPGWRIADARGAELATIEIGPAAAGGAGEHGAAVSFLEHIGSSDEETRPAGAARHVGPVTEQVIGFDGVAVVASRVNPIASLSIETLARLYSGQITDWFELGADAAPITLYLPPETSGTTDAFYRLVLKPRNLRWATAIMQSRSDTEVADAVARDPHGIGLVSFAAVRSAKALNLETQCGLITRPSSFAVKTEEYPLVRRLYLSAPAAPPLASARGLIRIAASPEVQHALSIARLVDLSITAVPLADQAERMASAINAPAVAFDLAEMRQMLADFAGASRLSVNLRFNPVGDLDAKARRDIALLAKALKEPPLAGKRVLLAGFTDAAGRFQANLTVGLKRAGQVRTALLAAAGAGLDGRLVTAKGYGALAPVACNSTGDGQRLNRRVEVWIAEEPPHGGNH